MQSFLSTLSADFTFIDGYGPLATDFLELWSEFPQARAAQSSMEFWLLPQTAIIMVVLYLLSIPFVKFVCETIMAPGPEEQERRWKALYDSSRSEKQRRIDTVSWLE